MMEPVKLPEYKKYVSCERELSTALGGGGGGGGYA